MSAIEFSQVSKTYAKELGTSAVPALRNLSFDLETGKTLGLIGANGAGKSTCLRLVMDFIRPNSGDICLMGSHPSSYDIRNRIGYLPEVAGFPPNLNALDMLKFAGRSCGLGKNEILERTEFLLRKLELWDARKRPLRSYSKGMQQRASFAVALINDPDLLILDEPMSGLDPLGRDRIISLILDLKMQGKTILLCSHILEDVDRLVDNLLVLHRGCNLFFGTPKELCSRLNSESMVDAFLALIEGNSNG